MRSKLASRSRPWPDRVLSGLAAIAMLLIAGYSAARLVLGHRRAMSGSRLADFSNVVMGTAMAGMFLPVLAPPLPVIGWIVLFGLISLAFVIRLGQAMLVGSGARMVSALDHVVVGAAMLIMVAAGVDVISHQGQGLSLSATLGMDAMHHGGHSSVVVATDPSAGLVGAVTGGPSAVTVTLALVLAAYLVMATVRHLMHTLGSARTVIVNGPGEAGWFMAPIWLRACECVMAAAMVGMLWAV